MSEQQKHTGKEADFKSYKSKFVPFLLDSGALTFGDYTLKSGRQSPYMVNTGAFNTGPKLSRLGCFYAKAIHEKIELGILPQAPDIIYGAAYKGIPLAAAVAIAFSCVSDEEVGYCFNRKEAKDHGEGGRLVGMKPQPGQGILIIDDVMTAGTALRETLDVLRREAPEARILGCVIAVDRRERGTDKLSAVAQAQYEHGFPVFSIVDIDDIVAALKADKLATPAEVAAIERYLLEYKAE
ncbi:MAG: orotate phosphoribosyltransferase [Clostridiales Family XIII bacterium]|jgi:orotate phosphoribosyltransferase|nr:orotate phosphoribosyltransferase [Clostridiales Family XIII bacterium]